MSLKTDIKEAVGVLEQLQTSLVKCDDRQMRVKCHHDLNAIMTMLKNPMLNKIVTIQEALQSLKVKVAQHPSLLPEDFDISADGKLILSASVEDGDDTFVPPQEPVVASTKTSIDSQSHFSIGNDDEFSSSNSTENRRLESMRTASVSSPQKQPPEETSDLKDFGISSNELRSLVEKAAEDKQVHHVRLSKPEGTNLGFSVVGLKSEQRGDLGIYIKDIQQSGIAGQDGRLQDGDQILAIDGKIIDAFISHQKAISILQNASNVIDLYVARDPSAQAENEINSKNLENQQSKFHPFASTQIVPPSHASHTSNMLNTEWAQVEVIVLVNVGSGLGFGIVGGRSTGVVVKTILPGGVADRDMRLHTGDHILQIGDVNLRGLGSDQVASVLRKAGNQVRLVVARPVESASPEFPVDRTAPIVETRVLNDPEELERHLMSYGDPTSVAFLSNIMPSTAAATSLSNGHSDINYMNGDTELLTVAADSLPADQARSMQAGLHGSQDLADDEDQKLMAVVQGGEELSLCDLPEMESIEVAITKDFHGLGITIAGYVCEREELSGIFVKSVNAGSAAARSQQVQVNDQIIEVDGHSLSGMSNHAAVEVLKATSKEVQLKLVRYLRGPKFEQLQQAIANSELKTTPSTPNPARSSAGDLSNCDALRAALVELEDEGDSLSQEKSLSEAAAIPEPRTISPPAKYTTSPETRLEDIELLIDSDFCGRLKPSVETAIQRKWTHIIGDETDIVVAQLTKFEKGGGLGISLEGTVDVEDGKEVRPHHYIRSILPEGPVGKESSLKSGDELLEVNNRKLFGLNHLEVVAILKELPQSVRLVCGRRSVTSLHPIDAPTTDRDTFAARNILGGSLQNLLPANDRLVKAKSDGSLASSVAANSDSNSFTKVKSRSLEPLSGLAMWSTDFQEIELVKGERGLGFSILDYQDPINPQDTVIVIRSLVPGGVAEKDGRLIPGDRLIAVNGISLENASLDTAVAALKGATKGLVQIAVARPVSVLESPGQLDLIIGSQRSDNDSEYTDDSDFPNSDSNELSRETADGSTVRRQSTNISSDSPDATQSRPIPATRTSIDRDLSLTTPVATERLIGGHNESAFESRKEQTTDISTFSSLQQQKATADSCSEGEMEGNANADNSSSRRKSSNSYLSLQKTIVIEKAADHIGISYEFDTEMNGIIINSIREDGAVFKDGRLCTGDLIVAVSDICLGNRTDSEIKSILRNSQLDKEISITFVPFSAALQYKELVRLEDIKSVLERDTLIELGEPTSGTGDTLIEKGLTEVPLEPLSSKTTGYTESGEDDPFTITFRNLSEAGAEMCLSEKSLCDELRRNQTAGLEDGGAAIEIISGDVSTFEGKHWGPERRVDVKRDEKGSLGISIVGGKVDLAWNDTSVSGIFIKNVLPSSPAGRSALLKTGDRILEVEGTDLRNAPHEIAVEVIKKTANPVCFVVQSLIQWAPLNALPSSRDSSRLSTHQPKMAAPARTPSPELIQGGLTDEAKQELQDKARKSEKVNALEDEDSIDNDDERSLQGHVTTSSGKRIDRNSAGAMKLSKEEKSGEVEDQFGYTKKKIEKKYKRLEGEVILIDLQKEESGVGITLSGHKDRTQMAAFVCGINPSGSAYQDGRLKVGDEILEVNGHALQGISHLNTSKIFRQIPGPDVKIIVRRTAKCLEEMAVKPITQFPVSLGDESPEEKYARFNGLAKFVLNKGQSGLGIMIIEGKHADYGQGIFISDLQDGSIAAEAGLMVGDMILCVNKEEMVGINYEQATSIVKRLEGIITMWVANSARVKPAADVARPQSRVTDGSRTQAKTIDGERPLSRNADAKKPDLLPKPILPPKPTQLLKKPTINTNCAAINNPPDQSPQTAFGFYNTPTEPSFASPNIHPNLPIPPFTEEPTTEADPHTADIIPSKETIIEIIKEKMGLGLSIVGGSDTLLGAIIIHEVYPDGAASKDGRLNPGDQILEVNNENFRSITHQKALNVLRQTPSKVKMVVYREETAKEDNLFDIIDVQLTKKSGKGLGLSIVGRKNGKGVFISDLVPGGVAESDGRLMQGDQILEVNDSDLRTASQEQAAAILKCAPGFVSMKVGRLKPGKNVSLHASNATRPVTISDDSPRNSVNLAEAKYANIPMPQQPTLASTHFPSGDGPKAPVRKLFLERGEDGLGFSIVGGFGSNLGDLPIYVKSVFEKGAASKEGSLRRGDQILEVNGLLLNGLSHAQAVAILKESRGTVILTIIPSK